MVILGEDSMLPLTVSLRPNMLFWDAQLRHICLLGNTLNLLVLYRLNLKSHLFPNFNEANSSTNVFPL